MSDFLELFDSVVLAAEKKSKDTEKGGREHMVLIADVCRIVDPKASSDDIRHVTDRIRDLQLGHLIADSDRPALFYWVLNARGKTLAAEIERKRKPLSFSDRLASDKFQKIGSLSISTLSMLVSVAALVVAIFAYFKAR